MWAIVEPYEKQQRQWTLNVINGAVLVSALLLTLYNLQFGGALSLVSLALLDLACLCAFYLNNRGKYLLAAACVSVFVLVAITANIYEGDGLFDPGLIAYPIFVIISSMLFGRRFVPMIVVSAILPLLLIGYLQLRGLIDVTVNETGINNLVPMLIFIFLSGLAVWVSMSNIEKNLLQIRSSNAALQKSYEMTLYGWAKALEYRDKETEGHSRRVVELSQKLAEALNCTPEEIENIRRGAILHDIGKMGVPDRILLKPGTLGPDEWDLMRQHTQFGKEMLEEIDFLKPAMSIVYSHHEHWDGSGYPQGLKGQEIPLAARIFAIIDNWDALGSDRPYRKAWPVERIAAYVKENAGVLFDPDIVEIFLKMEKT